MKLLLICLVFVLPLIEKSICLDKEADVVTQVKLIVKDITDVTKALDAKDWSKLVKVSQGVSLFAGVAGPAFVILSILLDKGDQKHQQIMEQFKQVHSGIESLQARFDELKKFIELESIIKSNSDDYKIVKNIVGNFAHQDIRKLKNNYKDDDFDHFLNILDNVNSESHLGKSSKNVVLHYIAPPLKLKESVNSLDKLQSHQLTYLNFSCDSQHSYFLAPTGAQEMQMICFLKSNSFNFGTFS